MIKELSRHVEGYRKVAVCEVNGKIENLDPTTIPLIEYFNSIGLETIMSCEGHNCTNMSMFWIEFSKNVTDDNIKDFLFGLNEKYGSAATFGRFAKSMSFANNNVRCHWRYMAATKAAAACDHFYFTTGKRIGVNRGRIS